MTRPVATTTTFSTVLPAGTETGDFDGGLAEARLDRVVARGEIDGHLAAIGRHGLAGGAGDVPADGVVEVGRVLAPLAAEHELARAEDDIDRDGSAGIDGDGDGCHGGAEAAHHGGLARPRRGGGGSARS